MLPASNRTKLVHWLISNGIAMFIVAGCEFVTWFVALPAMAARGHKLDLFSASLHMGQSLEIYPIIFAPIVAWHLIDAFDTDRHSSVNTKMASSYTSFQSALCVFGASAITLQTRYFHSRCGLMERYNQFCSEEPLPWIWTLCVVLWIALIVVAIGKLASFVASKRMAGE